jgi:SAM-dependent methyltransferase
VRAIKFFLKDHFPALARLLQPLQPRYVENIFTRYYQKNQWHDSESVSGDGSSFRRTLGVRRELPALLLQLGVHSLLDAPCGDFHWLRELPIELDQYIGADIVAPLIASLQRLYQNEHRKFVQLNIIADPLPQVDVILCRDCLVHLSHKNALAALRNFKRSQSRYLLTTTFVDIDKNADILTGDWRPLNLRLPPFSLPPLSRYSMSRTSSSTASDWVCGGLNELPPCVGH